MINLAESLKEGALFTGLEDVAAEALALVGHAGAEDNLELQIRALEVLQVVVPHVSAEESRAAVNAAFEGMVLGEQHRRRVVCTGV